MKKEKRLEKSVKTQIELPLAWALTAFQQLLLSTSTLLYDHIIDSNGIVSKIDANSN